MTEKRITCDPKVVSPPISAKENASKEGIDTCTCPFCGRSFKKDTDGPVREKKDCNCIKCGYSWNSTVKTPKRCPNCGSYHWNETQIKHSCLRCGHVWTTRKKGRPIKCPKCSSVYWDKPRDKKSENEPVEVHKSNRELYLEVLDRAVVRCTNGRENVFDVCRDMNVSVLGVLKVLKKRNAGYRL